jgi:hypothetical protein
MNGTLPAHPQSKASVSGQVVGLSTTVGVQVQLQLQSAGPLISRNLEVHVDPDGFFKFADVSPGLYNARPIYSGGAQAVPVRVGPNDITGLVLTVPKQRVIPGYVLVEDSKDPVPRLAVEAKDEQGRVTPSIHPVPYQGTNTGQAFGFRLEPGEFRISVPALPAGYRIKSMTYGTTDLFRGPLKLEGTPPWSIVIRLIRVP